MTKARKVRSQKPKATVGAVVGVRTDLSPAVGVSRFPTSNRHLSIKYTLLQVHVTFAIKSSIFCRQPSWPRDISTPPHHSLGPRTGESKIEEPKTDDSFTNSQTPSRQPTPKLHYGNYPIPRSVHMPHNSALWGDLPCRTKPS